eukprot:Sspe_Gene.46817::Locus_23517_Transcript_2_2_Confidence_0.667_Length_3173::g.46817::m.46817
MPKLLKSIPKEFSRTTVDKWGISNTVLGRGATGVVLKGINCNTGQLVAIKRLSVESLTPEHIRSIRTEIDLLRSLAHPNILQYVDAKQTSRNLYIVTEYMDGGSLADLLSRYGPFPEPLAAYFIMHVLEGLNYLHGQGVIHRDVKGANVLTSSTGQVRVSDLGVSCTGNATYRCSREGPEAAGTPYWMAPEVIKLSPITAAADIWSLGCTAVELLTAHPPYHNLIPQSAMFHVVKDPHPPFPEGISDLLRDFLSQCFHKEPPARPTAAALLQHPWITKGLELCQNRRIRTWNDIITALRVFNQSDEGPDDESLACVETEGWVDVCPGSTPQHEHGTAKRDSLPKDDDPIKYSEASGDDDTLEYVRSPLTRHESKGSNIDAIASPRSEMLRSFVDSLEMVDEFGEKFADSSCLLGASTVGDTFDVAEAGEKRKAWDELSHKFGELVEALNAFPASAMRVCAILEAYPQLATRYHAQYGLAPLLHLVSHPDSATSGLKVANSFVAAIGRPGVAVTLATLGVLPPVLMLVDKERTYSVRCEIMRFLGHLLAETDREDQRTSLRMLTACGGITALVKLLTIDDATSIDAASFWTSAPKDGMPLLEYFSTALNGLKAVCVKGSICGLRLKDTVHLIASADGGHALLECLTVTVSVGLHPGHMIESILYLLRLLVTSTGETARDAVANTTFPSGLMRVAMNLPHTDQAAVVTCLHTLVSHEKGLRAAATSGCTGHLVRLLESWNSWHVEEAAPARCLALEVLQHLINGRPERCDEAIRAGAVFQLTTHGQGSGEMTIILSILCDIMLNATVSEAKQQIVQFYLHTMKDTTNPELRIQAFEQLSICARNGDGEVQERVSCADVLKAIIKISAPETFDDPRTTRVLEILTSLVEVDVMANALGNHPGIENALAHALQTFNHDPYVTAFLKVSLRCFEFSADPKRFAGHQRLFRTVQSLTAKGGMIGTLGRSLHTAFIECGGYSL